MTDKFISVTWPSGEAYDRIIWVIEHSYPALPMEVMLKDADIAYVELFAEFTNFEEMEP